MAEHETELQGALEANRSGVFAPLAFDVETYLPHLAECDLTEAQQRELLAALWGIMLGFVDLGLRIAPVQRVGGNNDLLLAESAAMLGLGPDLLPTTNNEPPPRAVSALREGMDS